MSRGNKFKVKKVTKIGFSDFRRILDEKDYYNTRELMFEEHGFLLPEYDDIPVAKDQLRIYVGSKMEIKIKTNEGTLRYVILPGFMTDYGSVPKRARGRIDNDAKWMILPSIPHDINFRSGFLSFNLSNTLFRQMIRFEGGSYMDAFWSYHSVQMFGGKNYNPSKPDYDLRAKAYWDER